MRDILLDQLSDRFCELGRALGFTKKHIQTVGNISEIYVINEHAIQLEIDWKENALFMYAVYIKDNRLPDRNVIYNYEDGHWCRKYIEEIYKTKQPRLKDRSRRYTQEYLFDCFDFYAQLINSNPKILLDFY